MPRPILPNQARLAARMHELRAATDISGSELARRLTWTQSRVSKLETGRQTATHEDVDAWADKLQLDAGIRDELHQLAEAAHHEHKSWLHTFYARGGGANAQEAIGSIERMTKVSRDFLHGMCPGILHTEAYAREALSIPGGPAAFGADEAEREKIVAARMARQKALTEPGRSFKFVLGEAALWARFGTTETLIDQLEQMAEQALTVPSIDLRVIPFTTAWPVYPLATFAIYDENMVSIEAQAGEHNVVDPSQIQVYLRQFELLQSAALSPKRSAALIREVAAKLH
ncbi:helix-turn-helix domain-containing protein [Amycolatopsis thailandensis]|uniref:helix-turn-helix domain-containing protein n=1 Tax=Amycolatopsis thailandensis TaxID=589330 RepID=UPI0036595E12